ncbi:MAG TPA: nuclear transport factor 2 family protein [Streptosporangiaceae bacterium]
MPATPAEVFTRLVSGVCEQRWAELPALYAPRTHVVHPMDPRRSPALLTRDELGQHFARGARTLGDIRFTAAAVTVHQTADPEVVIGEFEYRGTVPATGEPFVIPNVFVIRVRDGEIIESRDYGDHVEIARLLGGLDQLAAAARQRAGTAPTPRPGDGGH